MAHFEGDIQAFMALIDKMDPATVQKLLKKATKPDKDAKVREAMVALVSDHKTVNLTRLRKALKEAYIQVNGMDEEGAESKTLTPYTLFFKEQSAILKEEMKDASQVERVTEIGRRWKALKCADPKKGEGDDAQTKSDATATIIPETQPLEDWENLVEQEKQPKKRQRGGRKK